MQTNDVSTSTSSSIPENNEEEDQSPVIPHPAVFQIEMNDGKGNMSQHNITTLPRVGVFLAYSKFMTPMAFEVFLDRVSGIPQTAIFLKINKANIPFVSLEDRIRVQQYFDQMYFVDLSFGYAEHTHHNTLMEILTNQPKGLPTMKLDEITLFVPADTIEIVNKNIFWKVLLWFYSAMKSVFFGTQRMKLPPHNTIYIATVATL